MKHLRLLTLVPLAVLFSCAPKESGLRVNVKVRAQGTARVRADCIKLTVSNDAQELKSATLKRPADDDALFGVRKGSDLPTTVKLQASGYIGTNCADEANLKLNAQGEVVIANFPESGVTEVEVFVDPPGPALDVDRDGFVAAGKGGLDCKDDDARIFPGAGQVCMNTFDTDCDGQSGCDDSECGTATVCLDPPDRVSVTTSITSMLRYECKGPFRVELRNAAGVRVAIRDTMVALTSSLAGVTVHGTSSCGDAAVASLPIPYGQSFFEVYLKTDGRAFGNTTLTATAARVATPGTTVVEVHPQPVDHLEFTTPARAVTAGQCSQEVVTVEFRDDMDRRTDVGAPATITMSSTPGDFNNANMFFSDAACATPMPMGQLMRGQGELSVYVKVSRAGSFSLTATPSAGLGKSQPLTVNSATAARLAFTNSPVGLNTTQSCSTGLFTVQLRDAFDNPVIAAADLPARVSVTNIVNLSFFEPTGNCQTAAQTDFVIPTGSSTFSFRARGMTAPPLSGTLQATVLNAAPITPATQVVTISAGFASKFRLTGLPTNPLAGQCSQNPFSVELLDASNNPASVSSMMDTPFTLSTQPASTDTSFRFYVGAGCVTPLTGPLIVPAGSTAATFSYQGNKAVTSFEIRASSSLTPPGTFLPGNSIRPGPPGKLVFVAPLTQSAQAGACTPGPYVANVLDLFDNATSFPGDEVVSVSSVPTAGAGITVGATTCATGNTVSLAAGATQTSFTAQHITTGSYALTASVGFISTATPATLTVTPAPSTLQVDTPTGATATLTAGGCQAITVSRRDGFGNAAPVSGTAPVTVTLPGSTSWTVYSSNNCTAGAGAALSMTNTHTLTFSVSPRTAGAQTVTVGIPSVSQQATVNFQVNPGASMLSFTAPASGAAAQVAGGCTPVSVVRRDSFGNDVALGTGGGTVTFSLPAIGGTTVHSGTPCTGANAIPNLPLTATDASASFYVMATKSSPTGGPQAQSVGISLAAQSLTLTLTVSPTTPTLGITLPSGGSAALLAQQCQRVNVERRDVFMNLVPASGTPLTVTPAAGDLQTFVSTDCTGTANGPITVTAGASTRDFSLRLDTAGASARSLTVTIDTTTAPLSLTISPNVTAVLVVQGVPATAVSGACLGPLTVRRRDAYGNDTSSGAVSVAMSSAEFLFSTASDCSSATSGLSVPIADASSVSGNFYATAALVGAANMTAAQGGANGSAGSTISAGAPAQLAFTTPVRTFIANSCGGAGNVITVQLRDAAGNVTNALAGGLAFTAVSTSAGGTWFTNAGCTTLATSGNFTIPVGTSSLSIYYRDTTLGSPDVSLTSALLDPAAQTHTVTVGPPSQLAFTTGSRTFTAAECPGATNVITVQLQDLVGNPVAAGPGGQAFTASSNSTGTVTWFTDDGCLTSAPGGGFTIPLGSNSVSLYYKDTRAASVNISLASPLADPAAQPHTVVVGAPAQLAFTSAAQTVAALGCSLVTTVTLQDLGGNVVNAGTNRVVTFSSPGAANTTFYTNSGCTAAMTSNQQTMASGASTVTAYFKAENAGSITVFADSTGLAQGSQAATIGPANVASLSITTAPATIDAGFCQAIAVDRLDALARLATGTATVITPTLAPTSGALLFSDAACTVALGTTFSIGAGLSTTTIYLKGLTGSIASTNIPGTQAYTLTLTTGGTITTNVVMTVRPMVRRGSCTLANATITCAITPTLTAIDRTFLLFQAPASNADDTADDDNVTCRLNLNATPAAEVICERAGNNQNVPIEWQTVTFPYSYGTAGGASVQHLSANCTTGAATPMPLVVSLTPAVTLANSFLLFSNRTTGSDNNGAHFFTGQLSATAVTFSQNAAGTCATNANFEAQVVSWQGATVVHNVSSGGTGASFTPNATTSGQTFLLYSSRMTGDTAGGDLNNICRRRLRGEITGSTLTFTRGCTGAEIQDIAWQTVRLPASPAGSTVTAYSLGSATATATFGAVDLTRTVSFIGGQGQGGSASGSTTYSGADRVGTAQARVVLTNSTLLTLTRGASDSAANFTAYVMQLTP